LVSTKDIRTSVPHTACNVCGRTLLRGEKPEVYIAGGERRWVCDLCTARALEEGWVREGTVPDFGGGDDSRERRRSVRGWLRSRRQAPEWPAAEAERPSEPAGPAVAEPALAAPAGARAGGRAGELREPAREPRHVRAVPSSVEHKVASAVEVFNGSEHARTIAGVGRSLGPPAVSVIASATHPAIVRVVASWELCWYRYEIDLSDQLPSVRVSAQGAELEELVEAERTPNATADEQGRLELRA
jgi:hypothetical protein